MQDIKLNLMSQKFHEMPDVRNGASQMEKSGNQQKSKFYHLNRSKMEGKEQIS